MLKDSSSKPATAVKWPRPVVAVFVAIALFVVGQALAIIAVSIIAAITGSDDTELFGSSVLFQFAFAIIAYGSMLAGVVMVMRGHGLNFHQIGLIRPAFSDAAWAAAAFLVYVAAFAILASILATLIPGLDIDQRQDTGFNGANGIVPLVLVGFALVVLAPFTEEVLMRGYLYGSMRHHWPFWVATAVTSLIFASFHLLGGEEGAGLLWIAGIDTFVLSIALCYLREKTGRLWAGIGLHIIKNAIAFTALFILAS